MNFPSDPTLNQIHIIGNRSWFWNGAQWEINRPKILEPPLITIEQVEDLFVVFKIKNLNDKMISLVYGLSSPFGGNNEILSPLQEIEITKTALTPETIYTIYAYCTEPESVSSLLSSEVFETLEFQGIEATGGIITYYEDTENNKFYKIHVFLEDGNIIFDSIAPGREVNALIVAGGGGGSTGGGGAGGLKYTTFTNLTNDTYGVVVGIGGTGISGGASPRPDEQNPYRNAGENGTNSTAFGEIAIGGGGGGGTDWAGVPGGSGGGAASSSKPANESQGGSGILGQGFSGGSTTNFDSPYYAAGGGGASGIGGDAASDSGVGGNGAYFGDKFGDTYGVNGYFAGGGGGGIWTGSGGAPGGSGGGGSGVNSSNAIANTGSGGGGGRQNTKGGDGADGIVLIRYEITEAEYLTGVME